MLTRYRGNNGHLAAYVKSVILPMAVLVVALLLLNGCSSSDSSSGEVVIGLTDAEGDYASYTVDVQSLTLTRRDGTVVETLPLDTRVDFAQYTELTEFLTAATIPSGVYTKASMVLDYSNAEIQVEDAAGNIVPVTVIQDLDGNPVQTLDMSVHLEDRDKLVIAPGIPAHITLDFDLKASNTVEFTMTDVVQTVSPFLVADVELERPKPHRVRGPLESVDVAESQFKLILRPFHRPLSNDHRRYGVFTVQSADATVYEIDGVNYTGIDGLNQLDTLPQYTATVAIGELQRIGDRRRYVASEVYAGSSVPGGDLDVVRGLVTSRSGNSVSLKGVTLVRNDGSVIFNDSVTVDLAVTTKVTKQQSSAAHTIDEISVGQKLTVFGVLSGDSTLGYSLDASNGLARMHLTTVRGNVVQVDSPMALSLQSIGHRAVGMFDFTGTGVDAANDADPAFYEVNTGSLSLANVAASEPVKVRGFVRAFGMAPEDFDAQTLVLVADARALMMVNWVPASTTAITSISDTGITLDLSGTGRFHHVNRIGVITDLTSLGNAPVLAPEADGRGIYAIVKPFTAQVFRNYPEFARELSEQLNTRAVRSIQVKGKFDDNTATMTVRGMRVVLR